ncbi:MAG: hypothetical protein PHO60_04350, partial [Methanothrix sp.]|nr:hypothetical protein [Methanothrix sp.]
GSEGKPRRGSGYRARRRRGRGRRTGWGARPETYEYYFVSWKVGDKVVNKYIGSPRKMTREAATAKARKMKAGALGLR